VALRVKKWVREDGKKKSAENSGSGNTAASHAETYTTPARPAAQWM
jgi:hypothetical protein